MKVYRENIEIIDVEIDDKSTFKYTIMGEEVCELNFTSSNFTLFLISDFIIYENKKFVMNTPAKRDKIANNEYSYTLRFEAIKYELGKVLCKLDGKLEFPLNVDIEQIQDLVIENMNEVSSVTWAKGTSSITAFNDIQVANENCLEVLNKACLQFGVEFEVVQVGSKYVINVRDLIGIFDGTTLEYKKGIFKINIQAVSSQNLITKLYARGGNSNIPDNYGYDRIQINPISANVSEYGTFEGVVTYEDIYPKFDGSVDSSLDNTFTDGNIDFDINSQLISGVTAKCVFLSGDLAGYEFEISAFDNSSKRVTLNYLTDDIGQVLPNTNLKINASDRYTFVDIYMPNSYVTAAELELQELAESYLAKYSIPLTKYSVVIDARYLRQNSTNLYAGQKIKLVDLDMGINEILRIYSITQSLADPYQYTIELTDNIQTSRMIELLYSDFDTKKSLQDLRKELRILKNN